MLSLADALQHISRACTAAGLGRIHCHEIKGAFEKYGRDWLAHVVRWRHRMPNETPVELVQRILRMTQECRPSRTFA